LVSLSETHQSFAVDYGSVKFYHPDYLFGGFEKAMRLQSLSMNILSG
jgi:hypothetical protein